MALLQLVLRASPCVCCLPDCCCSQGLAHMFSGLDPSKMAAGLQASHQAGLDAAQLMERLQQSPTLAARMNNPRVLAALMDMARCAVTLAIPSCQCVLGSSSTNMLGDRGPFRSPLPFSSVADVPVFPASSMLLMRLQLLGESPGQGVGSEQRVALLMLSACHSSRAALAAHRCPGAPTSGGTHRLVGTAPLASNGAASSWVL